MSFAVPTPDELRELRKQAGLSQAELADRIGVHQVSVSRWETGLNDPSLEHLRRYIEVCASAD